MAEDPSNSWPNCRATVTQLACDQCSATPVLVILESSAEHASVDNEPRRRQSVLALDASPSEPFNALQLPAAPPQQLPNTIVKPCSKPSPSPTPLQPMTSESRTFWSDACYHAQDKPLQAKLDAAYASCGVTVRIQIDNGIRCIAPGPCCRLTAPDGINDSFALRVQLYPPLC